MGEAIIVTNEEDISSTEVIKWLLYLGKDFTRVNQTSRVRVKSINISDTKEEINFFVDDQLLNSNKYTSYWYRRGDFKVVAFPTFQHVNEKLTKQINAHLENETMSIKRIVHKIFEKKKSISSIYTSRLNKLDTLIKAKEIGLHIPDTNLISDKKKLTDLLRVDSHISKGIQEGLVLQLFNGKETLQYACMTTEVKLKDLKKVQKQFSITKFQNKVNKLFELRIFLFNGKFYPMAIFSQNNPKTSVDFRNYDLQKPNRTIPFALPNDIEEKLYKLFSDLQLNSGSADMIVDNKGKYIFLEINPIGQFGMVSKPCNYYLEEKIANFL